MLLLGYLPGGQISETLPIPAQADWTDYGEILEPGDLGDWDFQHFGGFATAAVKRNGVYFLYYQGAGGYRIVDDSVTWRAIGVAASPDGINFTKHAANPVLAWFPNDNGEEGAVSAGVTLDATGEIVVYYGANVEQTATLVNADGRLAASADGLHFVDHGIVLNHQDWLLWGSGDEVFPIIAIQDSGKWFVYYIPNGTPMRRRLGVAWGDSRANLPISRAARQGQALVSAWGAGGQAKIGPDVYVLFLNDLTRPAVEARTVSLGKPDQLSPPLATYQFDDVRQATVLLDEEAHTWFMYYLNSDQSSYGVKLAPAGAPDATPPTAPASVIATPLSDRLVALSWQPAADPETGIVQYKVFRDGVFQATVKGWNFADGGLVEQTDYGYQVSAVNYHGTEGPRSAPIVVATLADATPPRVVSVNAGGLPNRVTLVFDEPVERVSAETPANYVVDKGIAVTAASLAADRKTVHLTTSPHRAGTTYRILVNNVRDRAQTPNTVAAGTALQYAFSAAPGLAGAWNFDEGGGTMALDTANYGSQGALLFTNRPGPAWTTGRILGGLLFDGIDDHVTIEAAGSLAGVTSGPYTFAAWVNPQGAPPKTTENDALYSVLVRQRAGLFYTYEQRFMAHINLADGTPVSVQSGVVAPGAWHHLAMVVDAPGKRLRLFVDGQEASGSPVSFDGLLPDHGAAPYYIGASDPLAERYEYRFKGQIDEVRIYNRGLSPVEITDLFTTSLQPSTFLPLAAQASR